MTKEEEIKFPKILITAPQHESKMYAFDAWFSNIKNFTYPKDKIEIFLADNSKTDKNTKYLISKGITAVHTPQNKKGLYHTINDSHEACRQYAIDNGFDYMLHLETDVIPPIDVIERLLNNNRKVVTGTYDIFFGTKRKAMIQLDEKFDRNISAYRTMEFVQNAEPVFFNGKTQNIYHAGLGCALIHRSIFEMLPFRYVDGYNMHTDTWFANDCYLLNTNIYADTTVQCKHYNQTWLGVK